MGSPFAALGGLDTWCLGHRETQSETSPLRIVEALTAPAVSNRGALVPAETAVRWVRVEVNALPGAEGEPLLARQYWLTRLT